MTNRIFTSESVTEGHPDKLCDQVSDAVLDAVLAQDPMGRVACETVTNTGFVLVTGELSTSAQVDIPAVVKRTVNRIGYNKPEYGFDVNSIAIMTSLEQQSADIAMGVNSSSEHRQGAADEADLIGAGDQGMMFGYACRETKELMPAPIALAHNLTRALAEKRKSGALPWLRPDGKSQVTVAYDEAGNPEWCPAVVVSTQHDPDISHKELTEAVVEEIIRPNLPKTFLRPETKLYVNPTGRFVVGGPVGDAGLTGRKIIVDTYGGAAAHGGGAFSGKDPTKVDRSAAYMARYVAKNLVASGLCDKCQLQLAYAIGVAHPVSVLVDSMGTGIVSDEKLADLVRRVFDLRPASIIRTLDLRRPIYEQTAAYGHFGRPELDLPWERLDRAEELQACL
ncbi:MAG: methionine adenosyltransferase [Clostridiales bacterium]|nr:methionine adenosyltransferase [Clostridiales bacterium]